MLFRSPPEESIPAVGQGALGIEYCAERDDLAAWLAPLTEQNAMVAVLAEQLMADGAAGILAALGANPLPLAEE